MEHHFGEVVALNQLAKHTVDGSPLNGVAGAGRKHIAVSLFPPFLSRYNRRECFKHSRLLSPALVPVLESGTRKAKS